MKTFVAAILAMVFGLLAGAGTAALRLEVVHWDGDPGGQAEKGGMPLLPEDGEPLPRLVVKQTEYDFGKMDIEEKGSHDFLFSNRGQGELVLSPGGSTCGCAVAKLESQKIAPGKSSKVTVKWHPKREVGPYRESARIRTNDPARPGVNLTIKGQVTVAARAVPPELVLGRLSAGESATAEAAVFCYLDEPFEILGCKLLGRSGAGKFELEVLPLAPGRLKEEDGALAGRLLRVTVKPGLPLGAFEKRIEIRTNLKAAPVVRATIRGEIGKEISVVGPGWDEELGVLDLGTVDSQQGMRRRLSLIARGPHCKEVKFEAIRRTPDLLKVETGKTTEINQGKATQTPLVVEIPKGSPHANYLGSEQAGLAEIILKTNDPQVPQIRLRVRFAVEG